MVLLIVVLGLIGLVLLARPFLNAPGQAAAAKADLETARTALVASDTRAATDAVTSARSNADDLQGSVQGIGGDLWSWVPVAAGPVRDVRRLGDALDNLTSVAEVGVDAWTQLSGEDTTIIQSGAVDLDRLAVLTDQVNVAEQHLAEARDKLEDIDDSRMLTGSRLADSRNEAMAQIGPLADGAETLVPVLDVLPELLGSDDQRKFLIAILNTSELRYSGGAVLALSDLTTDGGSLDVGEAFDSAESPRFFKPFYWKKVKGNPFHRGRQSAQTATYAPSWPVAGHELLNAFRRLRGRPGSGLIAVDSVALGRLLEFTGPIKVKGYPPLTSENFVAETIGNYDAHPDPLERRELNKALAPAFTKGLLSTDDMPAKLAALHELAQGRHFAIYLRDPGAQEAFDRLGLTGDLSDTDNDYLGVFTQNTNVAKSDYWQRRQLASRVTLAEDGSARVRLRVTIHNDSTPWQGPYDDPRETSYTTRWNEMSIVSFLPVGAKIRTTRLEGEEVPFTPNQYFGRPFVRHNVEFPPQATKTFEVVYDVPRAAVVDADGELTYRLDLDPQGMVNPEGVKVRVQFPEGYVVDTLPEEWTSLKPRLARYDNPALETSPSFAITAKP